MTKGQSKYETREARDLSEGICLRNLNIDRKNTETKNTRNSLCIKDKGLDNLLIRKVTKE